MPETNATLTANDATAILRNSPVSAVSTPLPADTSLMKSGWVPPRNVWAGGIAGIAAWLVIHAIASWAHIDVVTAAAAFGFDPFVVLSAAIGYGISWITPPSIKDIVTRLNDGIIHLAQQDQTSNVSYVLKPVAPPPGASPVIAPGTAG